jgi:hypothetical protein
MPILCALSMINTVCVTCRSGGGSSAGGRARHTSGRGGKRTAGRACSNSVAAIAPGTTHSVASYLACSLNLHLGDCLGKRYLGRASLRIPCLIFGLRPNPAVAPTARAALSYYRPRRWCGTVGGGQCHVSSCRKFS